MSDFPSLKKGTYRHNKTGDLYEVIGVALQTESEQPLVIYRPLKKGEYELFARPHGSFVGLVNINGQTMPRFEPSKTPRTFIV